MDKGIFGTPEYMAPEQIEGRAADVDSASDQFALAVIAYELLTGSNPGMASRIVAPTGSVRASWMRCWRAHWPGRTTTRFPTVMEFAAAFRAAALVPAPRGGAGASRAADVARAPRRSRRPRAGLRVGLAVTAGLAATLFFRVESPAACRARARSAIGHDHADRATAETPRPSRSDHGGDRRAAPSWRSPRAEERRRAAASARGSGVTRARDTRRAHPQRAYACAGAAARGRRGRDPADVRDGRRVLAFHDAPDSLELRLRAAVAAFGRREAARRAVDVRDPVFPRQAVACPRPGRA